ncbi:MAG: hypothetical protein R2785_00875 [Flavobacteriaceae bacterium]
MKTIFKIIFFLCCISCAQDDFYDLSEYDDFMMIVTVYFDSEKVNSPYEYTLTDYKTNGYNQLISYPSGSRGSISPQHLSETRYYSVKEFKTVGIKITPIQNVVGYQFQIKEISSFYPDSSPIVFIEDNLEEETIIYYNFENEEVSIN